MPRQPSVLIELDRGKAASLQNQLAASLKKLVQTGVLRPGMAVPSSRELARDLRISRNTVIQAYDRLVGEGYLAASARRGLFVNERLGERILPAAVPVAAARQLRTVLAREAADTTAPTPFRPCQPDVRLFPLQLWNRLRGQALRRHGTALLHYQPQLRLGLPALRRSLAAYLRDSRGVRCDWRQVAITSGSQEALFLLAHLLLKPHARVAMEDPGYLGARAAWQHVGADIRPLPVDAEGVRLPQEGQFAADLVYTTPSRQFPTGASLSLARRLSLVAWAADTRTWIVEDDYDSEFRYSRAPLPSLQSLDTSDRVIYLGSMSKVLFPSLRIGYVVLPPSLLEPFAALRGVVEENGPLIDQATLAEFIEFGALFTHIRRSRRAYGQRLQAFVESAAELGLPLHFPHTDGGMNLTGVLDISGSDEACARRLRRRGLDVPPLSRYSLRTTRPGLVFGFTAFDPPAIREGLRRAAGAFRAAQPAR